MINKTFYISTVVFLLCVCSAVAQRPDIPVWEAHGVTSSEWKTAIDSGITEQKLSDLLSVGITVREYLSKPWNKFDIGEREWLKYIGRGLNDIEIAEKVQNRRNRPIRKLFNRMTGKNADFMANTN